MAPPNTAVADNEEPISGQAQNNATDPLRDVPEELQIHLGDALDWMENRTESFDGGVRLRVGEDVIEFREWKTQDLSSCFDVEEPEAEPYREAVVALALLLRVRENLKTLEGEEGAAPTEEAIADAEEDLELFAFVLDRIQRAIDASVLRGSLVGARNLSRFRDLVGGFRLKLATEVPKARKLRKEERRQNLKSTGQEFSTPSVATPPARKKKSTARTARRPARTAKPKPARSESKKRLVIHAQDDRVQPFPYLFCAVVVLALVHWGLVLHGKTIVNDEPSLDRAAYERILPLDNTFTAGGVLYATIGEEWGGLEYRDRLSRFQRFQQRAELAGFRAVILTDNGGDWAARWTRGGDTQVWAQ